MNTMAAAVAVGLGTVECRQVPVPVIGGDSVLVKTLAASICGSDLHVLYMGWNVNGFPLPPGFPGHEGVGVVVDEGRSGLSRGDLVLTAPSIFTARVFAEYQAIDAKYLLKLPDGPPAGPPADGPAARHRGVRLQAPAVCRRQDRRDHRARLGRPVPRVHAEAHGRGPRHRD